MKKLSILLNVILIGFIAFQSFKTPPAPSTYSCNNVRVFDGITLGQAMMMVRNYRDHHYNQIRIRNTKGIDSRSVWFSLDRLKQFIYEIESNSYKGCSDDKKVKLGVRVYFGEYPDDTDWFKYGLQAKHPATYKGLHTLLMMPTFEQDGYNYDFEPTRVKNCGFVSLDRSFTDTTANRITETTELKVLAVDMDQNNGQSSVGGTPALNDGTLIPPPYLTDPVTTKSVGTQMSNGMDLQKKAGYPCTGAKLMQLVDIGTVGCGIGTIMIKSPKF